jgi:hypothetical protein
MNATAQPRPCTACNKLHISVAPGLCPECEKDSAFYQATRKKAEPRQFLPYPELLDQWRRRRAECRDWKKVAEQAATDRAAREQAEREKSYLWAVLNALNADMEPALSLAAELDKTRAELERVTAHADYLAQRVTELRTGKDPIAETMGAMDEWLRLAKGGRMAGVVSFPPEQCRRLVQLAHPDKHGNSVAAAEATRWLLENRP